MRLVGVVVAGFLFLAEGESVKPHLVDLTVRVEAGNLDVGFELANVFDEALIERIQTGLPTGFDFRLKLVKNLKWWFDRSVKSANFHVITMYNAVTGEYLVNFKQNGKLIDSRVVREIPELRDAMTRFNDLRVFDVSEIQTDRRLWVRARAELGSRNLLLLIPTTIKTDWVESRKFRLPETPE